MNPIWRVAAYFTRIVFRAIKQVAEVFDLGKHRITAQVHLDVPLRISGKTLVTYDNSINLFGTLRPKVIYFNFKISILAIESLDFIQACNSFNFIKVRIILRSIGNYDSSL